MTAPGRPGLGIVRPVPLAAAAHPEASPTSSNAVNQADISGSDLTQGDQRPRGLVHIGVSANLQHDRLDSRVLPETIAAGRTHRRMAGSAGFPKAAIEGSAGRLDQGCRTVEGIHAEAKLRTSLAGAELISHR